MVKTRASGRARRELSAGGVVFRNGSGGAEFLPPLPPIEYVFRWEGRLVFKTVHNFLVEAQPGLELRPQLSKIQEARWFSDDAARRALSFKNSQETLDAAIAAVRSLRVVP